MRARLLLLPAVLAWASPTAAQDTDAAPAFRLSGAATLASDYRLRGISQTDRDVALQGSLTLSHRSGLYATLFAANLKGWGTFGGPDLELDLTGGWRGTLGDASIDAGITWYNYPGGAPITSYVEPTLKLSGSYGPAQLLAGVAWAPPQKPLGNWSNHPDSRPGSSASNLYLWGDASSGIPRTPVTLKAHLGWSDGNPGLGPNGTSVAPTGRYWDWLLGADVALGPVVLGIAYVDTDISPGSAAYRRLQPNFATRDGTSIAGSTIVVSLSAAF
ncbi:MAG: hypothetical protein CFE37_08155 [Alphaproteobacteria bacterium PA4]|nr:MAG: hypothetical protein CFE37_08155 [Alphaproteobacteria bacterium PA4]